MLFASTQFGTLLEGAGHLSNTTNVRFISKKGIDLMPSFVLISSLMTLPDLRAQLSLHLQNS